MEEGRGKGKWEGRDRAYGMGKGKEEGGMEERGYSPQTLIPGAATG